MPTTTHRLAGPAIASFAAALTMGLALGVPAVAQTAAGSRLPGLRGDIGESTGGPPQLGAPDDTQFGTGQGLGSATAITGGDVTRDDTAPSDLSGDGKPSKFALPRSPAKTKDRARIPLGIPKLQKLEAYPNAVRPKGGGATIDTLDNQVIPGPTVAAIPSGTRLRPGVSDDGFDPPGIKVGSLRLTPFVGQSLGYDSNPDQTQTGRKPSVVSRTEGGLGVTSEWSSSELTANLRGGYNTYFSDHGADRPDGSGTIDYRYDATRDTTIDAEQRFTIDTQRPGSPELNVTAVGRPLITTFGETLGGTQTFGRFSLGLHGTFDRTMYENAKLSDGTTQDLADENFNDYGLHLRGSYEISPMLRPYADLLVDRRQHDDTVDLSGYRRDSDGVIGQIGATFELTRLITGDLSGGYGKRVYDDPRLRDVDGPVINGTMTYAITPLTTLALRATTGFGETNLIGASGTTERTLAFDATHQLLRNLTLTGSLSYQNIQYVGVAINENTWSETLRAEYHLSRMLVATATYNHEKLNSSAPGSSFSQDVMLLGLRLQR